MVGELGFEPRQLESESRVLPLDDSPTGRSQPPSGRATYPSGARIATPVSRFWHGQLLDKGRSVSHCFVMAQQFGPVYCETPVVPGGSFPVEPWNALSSLVICVFGVAALLLVMRRAPRDGLLYALAVLLILNGAGSTLWHGLRTGWSLAFDVAPALIFVLVAAVLWARAVRPARDALILAAVLVVGPLLLGRIPGLPPVARMAMLGLVIIGCAVWLIANTWHLNRAAALSGASALGLALVALTARSIDPLSCGIVPQGSHFLWHIFLSSAAFMLMLTLLRLRGGPVNDSTKNDSR